MKKETFISMLILALGILFELIYLNIDSTYWGIKLYLMGSICIVIGTLGLIIYALIPYLNKRLDNK